jgi:hypothetical protein
MLFHGRSTAVTQHYFTQLVDGGRNTCHLLGVTDKILTHTEIKHYTNVGIHNDYTLVITVIGTIRYYQMEYNRKQ